MIPGGGAPEIEISLKLAEWAKTLTGMDSFCVRAFAEALEVIPYTLAENAGLDPISIVTELRSKHAQGEKDAGINVRKGAITNIWEENVIQPLLVTESILSLATEAVCMILKIDGMCTLMDTPSNQTQRSLEITLTIDWLFACLFDDRYSCGTIKYASLGIAF
jgi:T-complex protein 1 subunit delta